MPRWVVIIVLLTVAFMSNQHSETVTIYVNSSKRSSGITPQFTVNLSRPITQIKSFEIIGVEIPYSFYNVWKGNVGMGEITDNGNLYTLNHGNLAASTTVAEAYNFVVMPATLMIKIDNRQYPITLVYEPAVINPVYQHIQYSINTANVGITCSITITNYKLNFNLTTTSNFTKIGFYLSGTSVSLANYIGLTETIEIISLQPTNTVNLLMPSTYKIFNPINFDVFTDYVSASSDIISSVGFTLQAQRQVSYYSSYSIRKNDVGVGLSDYNGTLEVDTDKHYISYLLGFNTGSYSHLEQPPRTIRTPIKPPKYYENRILIDVGDVSTYGFTVADGYYTPSDLATYMTSQFALITELATSTVTASSAGIITMNIRTANPHNFIKFRLQKYYGWNYLIYKMGFEDQFVYVSSADYKMEVTGVNITSATFVGSRPFNYRPTHLYIRSETLGQLTKPTASFIDDPTYQLDYLIHKIQINASPGGTIKDTKKYNTRRVASSHSPITSIDFSLYDEDGQLVQLNGRNWAIGVKIEF